MKLFRSCWESSPAIAATSYKKDGFGWQLQRLLQRLGEWWEKFTAPVQENAQLPDSTWWAHPLWEAIAKTVFWLALAGLVLWLIWALGKLLTPYWHRWWRAGDRASRSPRPSKPQDISVAGWLARSRKFQQSRNYRQACICLYRAMLQQLHDRGLAPHDPSRTDGEYLQIIQQLPHPQPYRLLFLAHQQLCFSRITASESLWESCQQAYRSLHSQP